MAFKRVIQVVNCHSGEPMPVIVGGVAQLRGNTVYEKMLYLKQNDDELRHLMLNEPRGYPPMCINIVVPSNNPLAEYGYIILEHTEYPMMSGGNTIAVATVLLETGMIKMKEPYTDFNLETAGGLIGIHAECRNGKCISVRFKNMPAFSLIEDAVIDVPTVGKVTVDVAWGGMFDIIADVRQFPGLEIKPEMGNELSRIAALLIGAGNEQLKVPHPDFPDIKITAGQISGPTDNPNADWKNTVGMPNVEVDLNNPATWKTALDRCPCGTGTCAKMASLYAKGKLKLNEPFRHENVLGIVYTGELVEKTKIHDIEAVVPTVAGQAWITGFNTVVLDDTDPFPEGYRVTDIWGFQ